MAHVRIAIQKYTEFIMPKSHLNEAWFQAPDNSKLAEYIEKRLPFIKSELKHSVNGKISALIVPHAGYAYSLDTALTAYTQIQKEDYDRVLILSPSHHFPFYNQVGIEPSSRLETSTGDISFDENFASALKTIPQVVEMPQASKAEHSIHIQMPLIRYFLGDIPVAALMFGKWKYEKSLEDFAHEIYKVLDSFENGIERTLIILSSDFTHYGNSFGYIPFESEIKENLYTLDHNVFHAFASQDIDLFEKVLKRTGATVCGATAMKFLLTLLPDNTEINEIFYTTSGEMMNDYKNSVSYLSASVVADWKKGFPIRLEEEKKEKSRFSLEEQALIIDIAKACVDYSVKNRAKPKVDYKTVPPIFNEDGAVFVTLEKNGRLRGCIGDIIPQRPLIDSIIERSYSASLEDPRFPPVSPEELPMIDVEVSVLSPPVPTPSYENIILGKHGIILQKGKNSAVFLPQVPTEQGWSLEETLSHLSQKAGLSQEAWKEDCIFYLFTAEIFH